MGVRELQSSLNVSSGLGFIKGLGFRVYVGPQSL